TPPMETRKLQLTGGSTFTVSLPKEWAQQNELEPGDAVDIFPLGRMLLVQPDETANGRWNAEIDADTLEEAELTRLLQAFYTTGFDTITVRTSRDIDTTEAVVAETIRKFIGLETLETGASHVTVQSLLDSTTVSVEQTMVQLTQVALSMHADAIEAVLANDVDRCLNVIDRDDQVDRLYAMITRHFQRSLVAFKEPQRLSLDQAALYDYQTTARHLERVGDHAEKIATLGHQFEEPPDDRFAEPIATHGRKARETVEEATNAILGNTGIERAHRTLDDREELRTALDSLTRTLHEEDIRESHLLATIIDSIIRTAEYGANIAETALQSAARNKEVQ
ncbi:MAG: PhoU domain-containing protein, partial [Natronomonas sp.]